jgi:hypothetical protein
MALVTKPPFQEQQRAMRRIWKTPGSKLNWICLGISLIVYSYLYTVYLKALKLNPYAGPYSDPLRLFGILALLVAFLHENYLTILHDLQFTRLRFTEGQAGTSALCAASARYNWHYRTPSRSLASSRHREGGK